MRVGILVPSIGNFGQMGFYNLQEVGLARALDVYCEKVRVWRLIQKGQDALKKKLEDCRNTIMELVPAKRIGSNGIVDCSVLDKEIDVLICASDIQLIVPDVAKWAHKYKIQFIPYIGVTESHSSNWIKKKVMDVLFARNLKVYMKSHCLVKTPEVREKLKMQGVKQITVAPVGLDSTLLKSDYGSYDPVKLKIKYGYQESDRIVLFVGRLTEEKRPVQMVELFADIATVDEKYKLLMVGTGELEEKVRQSIQKYSLGNKVQMIRRIANSDIWELYRLADTFVNLNRQEIFGMSILEAMYYGCKVVAWTAPGPDFIIEDGVSGWLVDSKEEAVLKVMEASASISPKAHEHIVHEFIWDSTAKKIVKILSGLPGAG